MPSAHKVTTGTKKFASVVLKVAISAPVASASAPISAVARTHFSFYFNKSSTLLLINGISNDLQKLLKYFSTNAIFPPVFVSASFALHLNENSKDI